MAHARQSAHGSAPQAVRCLEPNNPRQSMPRTPGMLAGPLGVRHGLVGSGSGDALAVHRSRRSRLSVAAPGAEIVPEFVSPVRHARQVRPLLQLLVHGPYDDGQLLLREAILDAIDGPVEPLQVGHVVRPTTGA